MIETTNDLPGGALARITPDAVLRATQLVKRGEVLDLGSVLHPAMPKGNGDDIFFPFRVTRHRTSRDLGRDPAMAGTSFSTEVVMGTPHVGSHFDAFCHVQYRGAIYGGATAADAEGDFGWRAGGMETVKPIVTRGVLLDIAADRGLDRLPDETEIGQPEIEAAVAKRGIAIEPGDAVLIRTGKMRQYDDPAAFVAGQPGLGVDAAIWLYDSGMAPRRPRARRAVGHGRARRSAGSPSGRGIGPRGSYAGRRARFLSQTACSAL